MFINGNTNYRSTKIFIKPSPIYKISPHGLKSDYGRIEMNLYAASSAAALFMLKSDYGRIEI